MQTFQIISWYVLIFIGGLTFWLGFHTLFTKLFDKGYAISKVISLSFTVLLLWLLGFVLKIPINQITSVFVYVLVCILPIVVFFIRGRNLPKVNSRNILATEIVFFVMLCFGLYVSSIHSNIDNNTERMMDFAILNVVTTDSYLPAKDMWFSGGNINYYYFGQFFFGIINKVTQVSTYNGYLYALGFIFALASANVFALSASIKKSIRFGIIGVILAMLFSNFDFIFQNLSKYISLDPDSSIKFYLAIFVFIVILCLLNAVINNFKSKRIFIYIFNLALGIAYFWFIGGIETFTNAINYFISPNFSATFFWDNSRVIPFTINEFPYYSLIVGDLHPHYIDLIFFTTGLTLLFIDLKTITPLFVDTLYTKGRKAFKQKSFIKIFAVKLISLIILACGVATNSWELIVMGIFCGVKDFIFGLRVIGYKIDTSISFKRAFAILAFPILLDAFVYIGAVILQTPFLASVNLPVAGIKINNELSPFLQFTILWIIFFAIAVVGLTFLTKKLITKTYLFKHQHFVLILLVTGVFLVIFSEFFFVSDLFYFDSFSYRRANSVFKINYMGFVMFAVAGSWVLYKLFSSHNFKEKSYALILKSSLVSLIRTSLTIVIMVTLLYVPLSISQWSAISAGNKNRYSLDAYKATKESKVHYSNDKEYGFETNASDVIDAAEYLKGVKRNGDVLLEAPGEAYRFTSVGSTFSTMPTVVGWVTHEAQWRKYTNLSSYIKEFEKNPNVVIDNGLEKVDEANLSKEERLRKYLSANVPDPARIREADVNNIFNFKDNWKDLLNKYGVKYVWIGQFEKYKYGSDVIQKFEEKEEFEKVYNNTNILILKLK